MDDKLSLKEAWSLSRDGCDLLNFWKVSDNISNTVRDSLKVSIKFEFLFEFNRNYEAISYRIRDIINVCALSNGYVADDLG